MLAFRHLPLPFHDHALAAAKAAVAAQKQKKFWQYQDKLFEKHDALNDAVYLEIAKTLGLNMETFKADMASEDTAALIRADKILAASAEIDGTPTFLINGRKMLGALPLAAFKGVIDSELSKVNTEVAKGTAIPQARGMLSEKNIMRAPRADGGSDALPLLQWVPIIGAPAKGATDPLATIVVFSEFQCLFCSKVGPALERILKENEDVAVVFRHYPLQMHEHAALAAEAATEAHAQGLFWPYHDRLFNNQTSLSKEDLLRHGKVAGLNVKKLTVALETRKHKAAVAADVATASQVGVDSTPTMIINGRTLQGAQPYERIDAVVQNALVQARKLVKSGEVPRKDFYLGLKKALLED